MVFGLAVFGHRKGSDEYPIAYPKRWAASAQTIRHPDRQHLAESTFPVGSIPIARSIPRVVLAKGHRFLIA
jgi:hypothetical protein